MTGGFLSPTKLRAERDRQRKEQRHAQYRRGFGEVVARCVIDGANPDTDEMGLLKAGVGAGVSPTDPDFWSALEGAMNGVRYARKLQEKGHGE